MTGPIRVVGLDISLTSTGMSDGNDWRVIQTDAGQVLEERLDFIVRNVCRYVAGYHGLWRSADLVVMEGASYGSTGRGREELAALRLMVRHKLWLQKVSFAIVPPKTLKLYTTGDGSASKDDMVRCVDERHGTDLTSTPKTRGRYDMADARALADMGYDYLNKPLFDMARGKLSAMWSVEWPEMPSDN